MLYCIMALGFTLGNNSMVSGNTFKAKRKKFGVGSLLLLLAMGVIFVSVGFALNKSAKINPNWKRVNGTVVGAVASNSANSGTTYQANISYSVNGQTYTVTSSTGSSVYPRKGSIVQVAYDPSNPADARTANSGTQKVFIFTFGGIGVVLIVIAPIAFVRSLRRTEDIKNLMQTGQKLQGIIVDIQREDGGSNGQTKYRLSVSATDPTGTVGNYTSDWMNGIGGLAMADFRSNPIPLDVYINPSNPKDYYVDVSEVPNLTPERILELIKTAAQRAGPTSIAPPGAATPPIVPANPVPTQPVAPSTPPPNDTPGQPPKPPVTPLIS